MLELVLEVVGGEKCLLVLVLVPRHGSLGLVAVPVLFDDDEVLHDLLSHLTLRLVILFVVVHRTDDRLDSHGPSLPFNGLNRHPKGGGTVWMITVEVTVLNNDTEDTVDEEVITNVL